MSVNSDNIVVMLEWLAFTYA